MRRNRRGAAGFTLVDLLFVMMIAGVLMAMAVPSVQNIGAAIALGEAQRQVESELQQARLLAVTTNRPFRVRFNCPQNGSFRRTELIGTPGKPAPEDTAANRCSTVAYPYPPADVNPLTLPNHDGPVRQITSSVSFGAVQTIEFWPDGTAHIDDGGVDEWPAISGTGVALTLSKGAVVKTVTVNGLGKIQKQ